MRYFNNRDMQETILIKKFDPGSWGPGRSVGLAIGQLENHFGTVLHETRRQNRVLERSELGIAVDAVRRHSLRFFSRTKTIA
jgi:hypothetical protein